jgi:hypothetical protein
MPRFRNPSESKVPRRSSRSRSSPGRARSSRTRSLNKRVRVPRLDSTTRAVGACIERLSHIYEELRRLRTAIEREAHVLGELSHE